VVVVELVPGTGSLGMMFGLKARDDLIALLRKEASTISEIDLKNALIEHESGVSVLP
jgi:hypothetical protein